MHKLLLTITLAVLLAAGFTCGMWVSAAQTCDDFAPDKAFVISSNKYSVSTNVAEILRGKSSFPVTIYGPPTEDSAGAAGVVTLTVSGGENLGILNGQEYVSYKGEENDVKEVTVAKIPACGYISVMFKTNSRTTPATYKITAHFPNGSTDYVKVKIVRYFGELDNTGVISEPVVVPAVKPRTPVPTPVPMPVPEIQPTAAATPLPQETQAPQSPVCLAGLLAGLGGAVLLFRRT